MKEQKLLQQLKKIFGYANQTDINAIKKHIPICNIQSITIAPKSPGRIAGINTIGDYTGDGIIKKILINNNIKIKYIDHSDIADRIDFKNIATVTISPWIVDSYEGDFELRKFEL